MKNWCRQPRYDPNASSRSSLCCARVLQCVAVCCCSELQCVYRVLSCATTPGTIEFICALHVRSVARSLARCVAVNEATCQWLSGVTGVYRWLEGVQVIEFMTFNVESEFLSLFVHGFKRAESRDNLIVANLALRQQPWVAICCKTATTPPPSNLN